MDAGWRGPGHPHAGPSGQRGAPMPPHAPLTWHVDHAAVAAPHHGLLLTLQAAGGNAVGVIAGQHLLPLHAGPAVPPRLRQVGELPGQEGRCCRAVPGWVPVGTSPGAVGHPALPAAPGRRRRSGSRVRHQSPADGCRVAHPGCGSGPGCQLQMTSRLRVKDTGAACLPMGTDLSLAPAPWSPAPIQYPAYTIAHPRVPRLPSNPPSQHPSPVARPHSLVSLQMGRYSSCWMSSMISSPLPMPPWRVTRGFLRSPLKV